MARHKYHKKKGKGFGGIKGLARVITGLIALVILWILMYAFQLIIKIFAGEPNSSNPSQYLGGFLNTSGQFGQSVTLLQNLPQIIGVIAGIFIVVYIVSGFRQMKVG